MEFEMEYKKSSNDAHKALDRCSSRQLSSLKLKNCSILCNNIIPFCILISILFLNLILFGMTAVILAHIKTQPISMKSSSFIEEQTSYLLINQTLETAQKVNELHKFIDIRINNQTNKVLMASEQLTNLLLNQTLDTIQRIDELDELLDLHTVNAENDTKAINKILKTTEDSTQNLINFDSTLSNLESTRTSTSGKIDSILTEVNKLLQLQNESKLNSIQPVSCQDILDVHPGRPSSFYHVNSRNIFCNMGELCGSGGGWTRLAYLDMTDATQNCPPGLRLYQTGGVRACGRPVGGASFASVIFHTNGISYSQVCGRLLGYQYGSPDASHNGGIHHNDINSYYVDGVSITRGSPRQHVWTLIGGTHDSKGSESNCPCSPGSSQPVQSFVGNHYFCESGNPSNGWSADLYISDPLWDGQGCGSQDTVCCAAPGLPWFHRDYGSTTTTDYLELRVCGDEATYNEDVPVGYYEIYVK